MCVRRQYLGAHDCEAGPLHPDLRDAEQTCKACKATKFLTARKILSTGWKHQDVREGARSRRGSQEDEIWREAEGGTSVDDADVLREVRYEDADKYEAGKTRSEIHSRKQRKVESYRETAKLVGFGEDRLSQRVFMACPAVMREPRGGQVSA
jgi:hypothetical protein